MKKQEDFAMSEHFMLKEFTRSATAVRHHIDNSVDINTEAGREVVMNLQHICETILEPMREQIGEPVIVTSGYRCAELNKVLGGVWNSQHLKGEAVDFQLGGNGGSARLKECYKWLLDNTRFDQLIFESRSNGKGKPDTEWIHVSLCRDDGRNRQKGMRVRK